MSERRDDYSGRDSDDFDRSRVWVGGLTPAITQSDLDAFLAKYGTVQQMDFRDQYAFITFSDQDATDRFVREANKAELNGVVVTVEYAKRKRARPGEGNCHTCGRPGHWARDCPNKGGRYDSRDSGRGSYRDSGRDGREGFHERGRETTGRPAYREDRDYGRSSDYRAPPPPPPSSGDYYSSDRSRGGYYSGREERTAPPSRDYAPRDYPARDYAARDYAAPPPPSRDYGYAPRESYRPAEPYPSRPAESYESRSRSSYPAPRDVAPRDYPRDYATEQRDIDRGRARVPPTEAGYDDRTRRRSPPPSSRYSGGDRGYTSSSYPSSSYPSGSSSQYPSSGYSQSRSSGAPAEEDPYAAAEAMRRNVAPGSSSSGRYRS